MDNPVIIVVVVLVLAVVAYFAFFQKKAGAAASDETRDRPSPEPKAPARPTPKAREEAEPKPAPRAVEPKREPSKPEPSKLEPAKVTPAKAEPAAATSEDDEGEGVEVEAPSAPPPAKAQTPQVAAKKAEATPPPRSTRKRDVEGLRKGLAKQRGEGGFFARLKSLFAGKREVDPGLVEQIEEVLLTSDVGVATTKTLLDELRSRLEKNELADSDRVWDALSDRMRELLATGAGGIALSARPTVVLVVGVNGVGKTTTIGKLATRLKADGKKVVLAAGDTFRAAAVEQLGIWARRVGCEMVKGKDGANPAAVVFDAVTKAKEIGADVVLCDTAGRLHTKTNLMEELSKVAKSLGKALDGAPHETLLVLDATTGQNALQQVSLFQEAIPLSGIVLTKLDGTAKGGVILAVAAEHHVPVRYIGIGERADDLRDFQADEFVEALLGRNADA
jgi:fused signal recognition particle receptor